MSTRADVARPRRGIRPRRRTGRERSDAERSRSARWRVAVRLAQRQARRARASSLLIVLLVALPIAGMSGAAVYVDSLVAAPEEGVRLELGGMSGWVAPVGPPGAGLWQDPLSPWSHGYPVDEDGWMEEPSDSTRADLADALPAGTELVAVSEGDVRIETATGAASVPAWGGAVWDDRFSGRFDLVEGRAPRGGGEVLVTAATLERVDAAVGGALTTASDGGDLKIVGVFRAASLADDRSAVVFADAGRFAHTQWYLPALELSWADVQRLNDDGIIAYSRAVVLDPPAVREDGSEIIDYRVASMWQLVVVLAVGGAFAAYMVVMLAGAAFAVSARRQQRALAIAASVGAEARDLRRTIVLQGTVLGLVGGVAGIGAGIGLAALVIALTDDGSATMFPGFHVPWLVLTGILVFAVLVGTGSALVPARTVARGDTIGALRGARRPQRVRVSRPIWGSVMILSGVGLTVVSGVAAAAVAGNVDIPWDSPLRWLPVVGIIAGPVLAQLGVVFSGSWLLWLASRGLSRLGVAARLASRDAVANGSRTVPAFAAIGATVFIGVFAVALGTMSTAQSARNWWYDAPLGVAKVSPWPADGSSEPLTGRQATEAIEAVSELLTDAGARQVATIGMQPEFPAQNVDDVPAEAVRAVAVTPESELVSRDGGGSSRRMQQPQNNLSVVASGDLELATGVSLSPAQREAYDAGAALVLAPQLATDGTIEVAAWAERDWQWFKGDDANAVKAPDNMFEPAPGQRTVDPLWSRTLDAIVVDAPAQALAVAIAPAAADDLGLDVRPAFALAGFDGPPTQAERDRVHQLSDLSPSDDYELSVHVESGPTDPSSWLTPLLVGVSVLVLGASSVALGLARVERRPDDATLSAVGGTTRLRRAIGFWQGLVIAGFGTGAGAAAGVLPAIGFQLQSGGGGNADPLRLADVPWGVLVVLAVALPLAIAVVNWIVPPRHPDLTRRTAIA